VRKAFGAIKVGDPAATRDDFEPPKVAAVLEQTQTDKKTLASGTLTLTAKVSDNDRVASVAYFMDNVPLAVSSTATADGKPFTLSNFYHQLIRDPGLELGAASASWTGNLAMLTRRDRQGPVPPHGGSRYAAFKGFSQTLSQVVSLNPNAKEITLRLWAWISNVQGDDNSSLRIQVRSLPAVGVTPVVMDATLTAQDAWEDWIQYTLRHVQVLGPEGGGPVAVRG
jgi:hypothetical protein